MSADRRAGGHDKSTAVATWWADRLHRYLMAAVGVGTIAVALSVVFHARLSLGASAPVVLLILGGAVVAGSFIRPATPEHAPSDSRAHIPDSSDDFGMVCPSCGARGLLSAATEEAWGWQEPAAPREISLASWGLENHATAGDFLWESWAPTAGSLGARVVGPVPETAYVPPKPGDPVLYEEGEPIIVLSPEPEEPYEWGTTTRLGEVEPLPAASLVSTDVSASEHEPPSIASPNSEALLPANNSILSEAEASGPVLQEALEPTPPHLRERSKRTKVPKSDHPRKAHETGRASRCANCREAVPDPKNWRRCPDCQHQLCTHCIVEALATYEAAWCTHCAGVRHARPISRGSSLQPPPAIRDRQPQPSSMPAQAPVPREFEIDVPHAG